jgi:hypothetical protein
MFECLETNFSEIVQRAEIVFPLPLFVVPPPYTENKKKEGKKNKKKEGLCNYSINIIAFTSNFFDTTSIVK